MPNFDKKKEKPVTNRELSRWLAQGNGEYREVHNDRCYVEFIYHCGKENGIVYGVMVRKWDDDEWHTPTRKYMGLEDDDE